MVGLNERQERFCQLLVEGKTNDVAYREAGYTPNRANAARLKAEENIKARIAELQAEAAELAKVTKARVLAELARVAFADITEAVHWTQDGAELVPASQLPAAAKAAIAEVVQTSTPNGPNLRVKLTGKLKALELLAKHFALFASAADEAEQQLKRFVALQRYAGEKRSAELFDWVRLDGGASDDDQHGD